MKVYAPYLPLLLIVSCGIFISRNDDMGRYAAAVKSYAVNTADEGLLQATNQQRQSQGLPVLKLNNALDTAAQAKARDMADKNYWSHNTPDGREPWVFIQSANYNYRKAAENLAYGFATSESTVNGWMNSPSHRKNVLDPDLKEVGFGIVNIPSYQNNGPQTLVVAMYGQPEVLANSNEVPLPVTVSAAAPAESRNISYIQSVTAGKAPWSGFIVGLIVGSIIMYLAVNHVRGVRRALRTSENFVIHHPLFDITLVALLVLAAVASQTIGTIH